MKRKSSALALVTAILVSAVAGTFFVKEGKADPYPMPGIMITLENPQNVTYNVNTISVTFNAMEVYFHSDINFSYSLDNLERKPILNITTISEDMRLLYADVVYCKIMKGNFVLFNLTEGWHHLTVYCQTYELSQNMTYLFGTYFDEDTIDFFMDSVPIISFLSFENITFDPSNIPLNFTINQLTSKIQYSLDGLQNITINGNTTLTGLPNGDHNVTVYATDEAGNIGASETIYFKVEVPFPTTIVATASASVAIVGVGLLLYFKKRKH